AALRTFDYVFADGAPVAWLVKRRSRPHAVERVTARDMMWQCCAAAECAAIPVFLYGTTAATLSALQARLRHAYPRLVIAGAQPSAFRPLTPSEDRELVR